jgi:hypothetical protein
MLQHIKQHILNKLKRQDIPGFIVESLDCNKVSGWIIPKEGHNPDELRFQLVEKGKDISLTVHLFHDCMCLFVIYPQKLKNATHKLRQTDQAFATSAPTAFVIN